MLIVVRCAWEACGAGEGSNKSLRLRAHGYVIAIGGRLVGYEMQSTSRGRGVVVWSEMEYLAVRV